MSDEQERRNNLKKILHSPSYRVAFRDHDFLGDPKLRPTRMQLELLKPELAFGRHGIVSTIVVFGSTRIADPKETRHLLELAQAALADTPDDPRRQRAVSRAERIDSISHFYDLAREFARIVSEASLKTGGSEYVIVTGGGPGIMEAANRGAYDVQAKSIGLNIHLKFEQKPNPFITPELCFQFHYFAMRKMHFLMRAKALIVFPGGFGTLDELFDTLTLRQTGRMQDVPIILFGREYWEKVIDFQFLADQGAAEDEDLDLFRYAETPEEAWKIITDFHQR